MRGVARGFTLIEVLVALAIVVIGMAAVLGALTSSAGTLSYLRDKTFAQWVALNHIANDRLSGQQPATGNSNGEEDFAGRKWHWRQEVVATQVPGVVRIDVRVRPADVKADDNSGWFTTVSGIQGRSDTVEPPNSADPSWGAQQPFGSVNPNAPVNPANLPQVRGTIGNPETGPANTPVLPGPNNSSD